VEDVKIGGAPPEVLDAPEAGNVPAAGVANENPVVGGLFEKIPLENAFFVVTG
jgi:hypothetical protein